ncbi:DUF3857 domain-containing protein [Marinobacter sp. M1N3S26]|uniref:DUF3857 domain-containing protein n=1 Tax=Marinobacter sp. M1N3S26 TaxID=3382299 RepID=UPI00387B915C
MKQWMILGILLLASVSASGNVQWGEPDTTILGRYAENVQARERLPDQLTLLVQDVRIHVSEDEVRKRVREVWFYSDTADAHDYGTDTITFNQHSDTLTIHTAASVDRYGELREMDPDTVRVTNVQQDNIFTDSRQAVLTIPGIGAGSVTLLEYELVEDRRAQEMPWLETWYPQWFRPLEHFRLSVSWEGEEAPEWTNSSDLVSCRETPGKLTCKGRNLPSAVWEDGMSIADTLDRIVLAAPMTWSDVVSRARTEFARATDDVTGADALLARLVPEGASAAEGLSRVHDFVARDIRYVSLSEHGNTITPHSVADVLRSRYGDCKDKSALLTYLLTELGYDPYPVLVATDQGDPETLGVPSMGYFDHMVICLDLLDGTTCMDATDAYTDAGSTPAWIQGRVALPLRPNETPTIIPRDDYRWTLDVSTELTFLPNGGQAEKQVRSYHGAYAGSMRSMLAGRTSGERLEWAREQYASVISDLAVPEFDFGQVNALSPELTVSSSVDYPSFLPVDTDLEYVEYDAWLKAELESMYPANERYGAEFAGLRVTSRFDVDLGDVWTLQDPPAELDFQHRFGRLSRTVETVGSGRFRVTSVLDVPRQDVPPEKQPELRELLELMAREAKLDFTGTLR